MTAMRWNPIDHMNAACANKPRSGGKLYRKTTLHSRDAKPETEHAMFVYQLRASWHVESRLIVEDFLRAIYPERYEGEILI